MIVVFGSVNVDVLVPVPHLPAVGETVLGTDYVIAPGGKGANQALAARRAGAAVTMIGAVGDDGFAEIGLSLLRRDGVDRSLVATVEQPTGCAVIMIDRAGENLISVASSANLAAAAAQVPDRLLDPATTVVLQREVPDGENAALIRRARERGARIVLNLAPAGPIAPTRLEEIDLLVANDGEAATLGDDPRSVARLLRQGLVVPRGAAGSIAYLADGGEIAVPALPIEPVDTTGAGDTFVGVLAAGLDQGLALEPALRRASAAAALACLAVGAQPAMPDRAAIDAAVARLPARGAATGTRGTRRAPRHRSPA
jgi:ribokinase